MGPSAQKICGEGYVMEKEVIKKQKSNLEIIRRELVEVSLVDTPTLLQKLKTNISTGLTTEYVEKIQDEYGYNVLGETDSYSWYRKVIASIFNPFNTILAVLASMALVTGDTKTSVTIISLIVVSGLVDFLQENKSNEACEKLKNMIRITVTVIRDSRQQKVEVADLVTGDIIQLSAGDIIPADLRIVESKDIFISQSSLTGESEPLEKFSKLSEKTLQTTSKNPLDLENLCFMGTNVVSGSATAVVLRTGVNTYFGSTAKLITKKKAITNFDKGLTKLSQFLVRFVLAVAIIIFLLNGYIKHDWFNALLFAISVTVGLIPEMLPVVISANLTKGVLSMSKKRTIVKNMNSMQNFGAMDILCSDKTGTLTENVVVLQYHLDIYGNENDRILKYAYLNSNFQTGLKNLLDLAIIDKAIKSNLYSLNFEYQKIDEIPFDFTRRRMSVVLRDQKNKIHLITKGAVEEMLQICKYVEYNGSILEINSILKKEITQLVLKLHNQGMRVLVLAKKSELNPQEQVTVDTEKDMVLMGYLSFLDPPKQTAKSAIESLKNLNVKVKVLTGDNDIIAANVCEKVGIKNDRILFGSDIDTLDDEKLKNEVDRIDIFAKLTPQQKLRIIQSLRSIGHTVGFMGDGINDAPAMREADVAISVDSAVDIAKESADIILLKKDLNVLVDGVMEGRKVFCNIIKYLKMTLSSNFGNIFSIIFGSIFLPFLPMLPVQILLLNIIYDISQISIPWDNVDEDYLRTQKKWDITSIRRFVVSIGPISSICDLLLFLLLYKHLKWQEALFHSGWFLASLITQTIVIHLIRTEKRPFLESSASAQVLFTSLISLIVTVILPYTSLGRSFSLMVVPFHYYLYLSPIITLYIVLVQTVKKIYIKKYNYWL
jgi:Mg2+-importing ATPase